MILHTVQAAKDPLESLLSPEMLKIALGDQRTGDQGGVHDPAPSVEDPVPQKPNVPENRPALLHPAVLRCVRANDKRYREYLAAGCSTVESDLAGYKSYRRAMPPLAGRQNIRDFIACVAHGMLIGVFEAKDASRLLYAAQVAYTAALEPTNRLPGRPRKEPEGPIPTSTETTPGNSHY